MGDYTTQYIWGLFHKPLPIKQAVFHEKYSAVVFFSWLTCTTLRRERFVHLSRNPGRGRKFSSSPPATLKGDPSDRSLEGNLLRACKFHANIHYVSWSSIYGDFPFSKKRVVKAHMCINHQFQGFNVKTWMEQINPTCFVFIFILFFLCFQNLFLKFQYLEESGSHKTR